MQAQAHANKSPVQIHAALAKQRARKNLDEPDLTTVRRALKGVSVECACCAQALAVCAPRPCVASGAAPCVARSCSRSLYRGQQMLGGVTGERCAARVRRVSQVARGSASAVVKPWAALPPIVRTRRLCATLLGFIE